MPEVARALALRGAELIFMPAGKDKKTLWATWRTLIWARAIENLAIVVTTQNLFDHAERGLAMMAALERLQDAHPIGFLALMFALTLVGLLLFTHIAFVLVRALRPTPRQDASPAGPLPPVRDAAWHLAEALRLAAEGSYRDAFAHRFLALVLQLELRRAVAFRPSKTPAEYASEARLVPAQRGVFRDLVTTLYGAVFGARSCDAATFAEFDRAATLLALHDQAL